MLDLAYRTCTEGCGGDREIKTFKYLSFSCFHWQGALLIHGCKLLYKTILGENGAQHNHKVADHSIALR